MPKYEVEVFGQGDNYHDSFWEYDDFYAIRYGRRYASPRDGRTVRVKRIASSGRRDIIFEHEYAKRKDYKKSYKK